MKRLRKIIALIMMGITLITASGCAGVIAAAALSVGAYAWINGELSRSYDAPLEKSYNATLTALENSGLTVLEKQLDAFGGNIEAERSNGSKVRVIFKPLTEGATEIKVRVGLMGDRQISESIHEAIYEALSSDLKR